MERDRRSQTDTRDVVVANGKNRKGWNARLGGSFKCSFRLFHYCCQPQGSVNCTSETEDRGLNLRSTNFLFPFPCVCGGVGVGRNWLLRTRSRYLLNAKTLLSIRSTLFNPRYNHTALCCVVSRVPC